MQSKEDSTLDFIKTFAHFYKNYKWRTILLASGSVVAYALMNISPLILSWIVDLFASGSKDVNKFYFYLFILFLMGATATILRLRMKNKITLMHHRIRTETKVEMMQKLLAQNLSWHQEENTGSKLERIEGGLDGFNEMSFFISDDGIKIATSLAVVLGVFLAISPKYFLLALTYIVIYFYVESLFTKKLVERTREVNLEKEKVSGKINEFASNINTVKALGMEATLQSRINTEENNLLKLRESRLALSNKKWICIQLIAVFFNAFFIYLVGLDIISGSLTPGAIVIYGTYLATITALLNTITKNTHTIIESKDQIYRMLRMFPQEEKDKGTKAISTWKSLEFKEVSFDYKNKPVLDDLSLKIKRGEKIGLVGISGSGKSTLFKLLLKLQHPKKGSISFDGLNLEEVSQVSLLKQISVVPQETELFNMSIKQNVTLIDNVKVDYKRYSQALRVSECAGMIAKMKDRDETIIGEKGLRVSGGERQRIGIARAVYKGSDIIIFDEATSSLDYETERKILAAISRELKGKTIIVAAHRLSTLRGMDRIYVIKSGKVSEDGTYGQLVASKGIFYRLLKAQGNK